jgi:hypothetical protein
MLTSSTASGISSNRLRACLAFPSDRCGEFGHQITLVPKPARTKIGIVDPLKVILAPQAAKALRELSVAQQLDDRHNPHALLLYRTRAFTFRSVVAGH